MKLELMQNIAITVIAIVLLIEIKGNRRLMDSIEELCDWLNDHITKV